MTGRLFCNLIVLVYRYPWHQWILIGWPDQILAVRLVIYINARLILSYIDLPFHISDSLISPSFLHPFFPLVPFLAGQSQRKKTPESHIKGLPTRNHPVRQCLQPADRKHIYIQVSRPLSTVNTSNTLCVPDWVGRPQLWNTSTLSLSLSPTIKQKLLFPLSSHRSLDGCECKEVWYSRAV